VLPALVVPTFRPLRLFLEHLVEEPMPFSDKRTEQQLKKLVVVMGSLGLRFAGSRPHLIAASSLSKRERFYLGHPQYDITVPAAT